MVDIMTLVNLSLDSAALITVIIGLLLTVVNNTIQKWSKKLFIVLFAILTVYISCILWSSVSLEITGPAWASQLAIFLESLTSSGAMLILTLMLIHNCGENYKRSPLFFTVLPLFVIYCALLVVTQFTTFIYYITPDNVYMRGPYYFVLLIPAVLIMVVNLVWLFIKRKKLERKQVVAFSVFILAPMICMVVQIFVYGIMFIVLGSALGALYLMVVIQSEQIGRHIQQKEKIAQQRASISVLQMRPHFIYNAMTSIYYLCEQGPKTAQQVTLDFTNYLRKNFSAIAKDGTLPFTEELEHTRAYLAVEQIRFEGEMFVEFDTPHTAFKLPPLTL